MEFCAFDARYIGKGLTNELVRQMLNRSSAEVKFLMLEWKYNTQQLVQMGRPKTDREVSLTVYTGMGTKGSKPIVCQRRQKPCIDKAPAVEGALGATSAAALKADTPLKQA